MQEYRPAPFHCPTVVGAIFVSNLNLLAMLNSRRHLSVFSVRLKVKELEEFKEIHKRIAGRTCSVFAAAWSHRAAAEINFSHSCCVKSKHHC